MNKTNIQINNKLCEINRRTPDVKPFLHPFITNLLQDREALFRMKGLHNGPVHLIFPHIMRENIQKMQNFFAQYSFQSQIYFTCKPNKSKVFLKEAFNAGINIDVSSAQELITALGVGFRGKDIGCTNLKNNHYTQLAMEHGCLISVDNFSELETIKKLHDMVRYKDKARILLRVSNLKPKDRKMYPKISKFGIAVSDIPKAVEFILSHQDVFDFYGLHFHHDNSIADIHAGYIEHGLTLMEQIYSEYNLPSRILDIGGGLRTANIENAEKWSDFINHISEGLKTNQDTGTWNNQAYGLNLTEKGGIGGHSKVEPRNRTEDYVGFLKDVLENTYLRGRPLHRIISDNLISVMLEPGASLLAHAGVTLMKVNGSKDLPNCDHAVFVDANIYNISGQFKEPIMDFIHIPKKMNKTEQRYDAYIIDNLCAEIGIMSQKCMYFDQQPVDGDMLVMANTAAYISDFEDASPHMHPKGRKIVVVPTDDNSINFFDEEYYNQFEY